MLRDVLRNSFFCTIFIFFMMWIFSLIPLPQIEILDPIGQTLQDFDITDITYHDIKGHNHQQKDFSLNEEQGDTNIVIVNIGEQPRGIVGVMVNIINDANPKIIGIDAIFRGRKPDTLGDMILSEAIKNSGKVILASKFIYNNGNEVGLQTSHELFSGVAHKNSFVNLVTDGTDDVAKYKTSRQFYPKKDFKGSSMHFFALDLVEKIAPEKAQKFLSRGNEQEYINYVGNIGSWGDTTKHTIAKFTSIDFQDVLDRNFDPSLFKDKIVLMGFLGRVIGEEDIEDIFYSPLNDKYVGKSNPDMFGVVIHANVINMLMTENYIDQVPMYLKVILAVLICYLAVFILYIVFLAFPLLYGTLSKIVQFVLWIAVLFVIIGVFYNYKLKYDADLAVVTVLLAGDMVEIYHELVLPTVMKLYRLIFVKKR
jgi:CHASE2 domain-containing sensor protein